MGLWAINLKSKSALLQHGFWEGDTLRTYGSDEQLQHHEVPRHPNSNAGERAAE